MKPHSLHPHWLPQDPEVLLLSFEAELRCFGCGRRCNKSGAKLHCQNGACGMVGEIHTRPSADDPTQTLTNVYWGKPS